MFLAAAERGELLVMRCVTCAGYAEPGAPSCPACGGTLEWVPASGDGTVFSYAVVHQVFDPSLAGQVPYVVALVELAEGPRLVTRLVGFETVQPSVGAPVRVAFHLIGDRRLPVFRPAQVPTDQQAGDQPQTHATILRPDTPRG
jgi:uncharacterized OB-fold protein